MSYQCIATDSYNALGSRAVPQHPDWLALALVHAFAFSLSIVRALVDTDSDCKPTERWMIMVVFQILLPFSRDTTVLQHFAHSSASPARAFIRGRFGSEDHQVSHVHNSL